MAITKPFQEPQGVFTSEAALLPDFTPEEPLHREAQLSEMAASLKPILNGRHADNLFLYGPTGTGKTTCARHVARQLNEFKPKVNCVYINCWQHNTRLAILSEIAGSMNIGFPRRGLAADEVFTRVMEIAKKSNSANIIILDEFDQLCAKKEDGVVYDLTRAGENNGANFALVCISNNANLLETIDARMRSSLSPKKINFPRYTPIELKAILRQRAQLSLNPAAWSEDTLALCAGHAAKLGGDCRIALRCLWRAAALAERSGAKITEQHIRSAFEEKEEQESCALNEVEQKIVELLKLNENASGIQSGKLYELLNKVTSERTARNALNNLAQRGVVEIVEVEGKEIGGRGRSRIVKLMKNGSYLNWEKF
ncbi:MAG: AAA family ATPase [Candidatus Micrarchaeota archaeon]